MIGVYFNYTDRGPGKVVKNLLSGFDRNGIEYTINSDGDINLILQNVKRLEGNLSNCILGPNISTLPIDNRLLLEFNKYLVSIVPSKWVKDKYSKWIPEEKIEIWPVGIDTDYFTDKSNHKKQYDFLIYFKRRNRNDLLNVMSFLKMKNKSFIVIEYGNYNEGQFIDAIAKSKYGILIDGCESQGIAIQEMMSCNLPLLIWDIKYWQDRGGEYKCEATSIPYWDNSCGESFFNFEEIEEKFNFLINNSYNPRDYILKNLTIDISTERIINILN